MKRDLLFVLVFIPVPSFSAPGSADLMCARSVARLTDDAQQEQLTAAPTRLCANFAAVTGRAADAVFLAYKPLVRGTKNSFYIL